MSQKTPLVLSGAQIQQLQAADYANIGIPFFMHKNRLLNGDFNVWQRGPGLQTLTADGYWPDQWNWTADGTGRSLGFQQQSFTIGQTTVPDNPLYYCELSVGVGATGQTVNVVEQLIEGVQTFQGQTVTLSLWAKADATRSVTPKLVQVFGTGGSPSGTVSTAGSAWSLSTSWAKYTATVTLPSISGKTLGTNGNDALAVQLWLPVNTGFTIDIAHVQLEQGSNATQFETRPVGLELNLCKRYFEAIVGGGQAYNPLAFGGWTHTSGANGVANVFFPFQQKRTIPTISTPDAASHFFINCNNGAQQCTAVSFPPDNGPTMGIMEADPITNFTGTQLGQAAVVQAHNTDQARIWISAEL